MAESLLLRQGAIKPITAYHGTPHKVDKFSMDKIGTGEGAQAYGHGLYFADDPKVAKAYKEILKDSTSKSSGNIYTVDIPDESVGNMLLWDKPLSKQPEYVQQQLLDLIDYEGLPQYLRKDIIQGRGAHTGQRVYDELVKALGSSADASESLRQASIPGIRYLDQGSRGVGEGTMNTVVFDDSIIKILEENGIPFRGLLD
jgi:hypothetical protein